MAATYKMFIDGEWTDAKSGKTLGVINPANEETIAEIAVWRPGRRRAGGRRRRARLPRVGGEDRLRARARS